MIRGIGVGVEEPPSQGSGSRKRMVHLPRAYAAGLSGWRPGGAAGLGKDGLLGSTNPSCFDGTSSTSRQSSTASWIRDINSSSEGAWVWQPGSCGTDATRKPSLSRSITTSKVLCIAGFCSDSTPGRAGAFSPSSSRGRAGCRPGLTPRGYRGRRPGRAAGLGTWDVPLAGAGVLAVRRIGGEGSRCGKRLAIL